MQQRYYYSLRQHYYCYSFQQYCLDHMVHLKITATRCPINPAA